MKEESLEISVVIPCWNAAERISETLAALGGQFHSATSSFEIIIVDNNSSDSARLAQICHDILGSETNYRIVTESQPGLNAARNCGVAQAKGRYVIFLDDDAVPSSLWFSAYWNDIRTHEPDVVGGNILALPELPILRGFDSVLNGLWSLKHFGNTTRWLASGEYFLGANIGAKRSILMGRPFSQGLDREAESLRGGGELWLGATQYRRLFCAGAVVFHKISADRQTNAYLSKRLFHAFFADQGRPLSFFGFMAFALRFLLGAVKLSWLALSFRLALLRELARYGTWKKH